MSPPALEHAHAAVARLLAENQRDIAQLGEQLGPDDPLPDRWWLLLGYRSGLRDALAELTEAGR